ncbi:hypothetical protein B0I72DRAFT_17782 [Yarrowia lipolytica]|nr:hypothetical protein BKA90DRAFT_456 [Yarrowia lipolytica]RDW34398.1 hypothetical protein B0I72DRAFT_17782 [Yarrowia lipolytica]RDW42171.1 hypothetical protein B0I73DRAFT_34793 [Yarrowia lipolytica]RDW45127.1 hypothetical protein B0I74DRAFT_39513 [Yarrowia lipolytica]RDW55796.1 hypothetical protein B0I75DRAFT_23438 [Yarrowia lipolytica]
MFRFTRKFTTSAAARDAFKVTLHGRIAKAPETLTSAAGNPYIKYTVAINDFREDRPASFISVTSFEDRAAQFLSVLKTGTPVMVTGNATYQYPPNSEMGDGKYPYLSVTQSNLHRRHLRQEARRDR